VIINWSQYIGGVLNVLDSELLEQLGDRAITALERLADRAVIFVRTADGFLEDRRI